MTGFSERCEDFHVQQRVSEFRVEALAIAFFPRTARLDISVLTPVRASQPRTFFAMNSGPLSERICSGGPCSTKISARQLHHDVRT